MTPSDAPLITTIIPTYRRPELVRRAIESAARQTIAGLRICVYDNAAEPQTAAAVAGFNDRRIEYHGQLANLGAFANFQFGLSRVRTPFFSFLSDDDLLLEDFYATTVASLRSHPRAMFAATQVVHLDDGGQILQVDGAGWRPGLYEPADGLLKLARDGHINWTGLLFRREALAIVPSLDPDTGPSFDLDFELRLAARAPFVICDRPGAILVQHADSKTAANELADTWPCFLKIIDNATDAAMPERVRQEVRTVLERNLGLRLFRLGRAAARRGRVMDADRTAAIIDQRYGWRARARLIRLLAQVCSWLQPSQSVLQMALNGYRWMRSRQLRLRLGTDYGQLVR